MAKTSAQYQRRSEQKLRRAVYNHVSDLITSAYNIDHEQLEKELARVDMERENPAAVKLGNLRLDSILAELDVGDSHKRLQPPRGGFNLCCLVGKVEDVCNKSRVDGSRVRMAEVEVGDETGTVLLRARDEQIDTLREVSERSGAVVLRNCTVKLFHGKHIRLTITKWGKLSTYPDQVASTPPPPGKMNKGRNLSLIDLTLVVNKMQQFKRPKTNNTSSNNAGGATNSMRYYQLQAQHKHHSFSSSFSIGENTDVGVPYGMTSWIE